jgi:hypothetical protein
MTSTNTPAEYAARCAAAATHQGLDGVADELWRTGIEYDVRNMGGFCMAIVVENGPLTVVVTTWDEPEGRAVVGQYNTAAWLDGGDAERLRDGVPLVDVPEVVGEFAGITL